MEKIIISLMIGLMLIAAVGCKTGSVTGETIIRDRLIKTASPIINDSGDAKLEIKSIADNAKPFVFSFDSTYRYVKVEKDTVVDIKFVPKTQKIYYKIRPDTIILALHDTLRKIEYTEKVVETPLSAKVGFVAIGAVIAILLTVGIYMFLDKRGNKS